MLSIRNLHVETDGKEILMGLDLEVPSGEIHVIMGPNGSGKSTLAHVLAGQEDFKVTQGKAQYDGKDLLSLPAEERAGHGLFLGFQYPVEVPGVSNLYFLKASLNAIRKFNGLSELDAIDFLKIAREKLRLLDMDAQFLDRALNQGFSGGEKKRNEIFQMAVLQPKLVVLDEPDSGLDIDGLRTIAQVINALRSPQRTFIIITHYRRILEFIKPDKIHIISRGHILRSGGLELAHEVEQKGYAWLEESSYG